MENRKVIEQLTTLGNLKYLFLFGNPAGLDRDYLAVFDLANPPFDYELKTEGDDVYPTTLNQFKEGLRLFDPVFTEPVLTGQLVHGFNKNYGLFKNIFLATKSTSKIVNYLIIQAKKYLDAAQHYLALSKSRCSCSYTLYSLLDLTYVASYLLFAEYYNKPSPPVTFSSLQSNCSDMILMDIFNQYRQAKRSKGGSTKQIRYYYSYLMRKIILSK